MPRTQCQATALEVLCRRTGPPARRWRGAGPCHGPLSHPSASGGPTDPWGRPGAAIEAHAAMHPTPRDAPDPPQGVVGDATPPASPPWDARRHLGTAAWAKGHSAAPKCVPMALHSQASGRRPGRRFPFPTGTSNELAVSATAAARYAGRACVEDVAGGVAAAVVEAQAGWIRSRRVVRAFRHGTIVDDGPWTRGVTNICSGSLLAPAA